MKFRIFTTLLLYLFSLSGYAQLETAEKYADQIDTQRLKTVVTTLASDEYEGRAAGRKSGVKSANYISNYLKSIGVTPGNEGSYFQDTELNEIHTDEPAYNVIGLIEGSDKKNEYLVLSAHYNQLGIKYNGDINYGADNNASGVSALLEIANMFVEAKKNGKEPRRSIIFLFPTSRDKDLAGSKYYVENPIFPLNETVGCINLNMIGRITNNESDNHYLNIIRKEQSKYDKTPPSGELPSLLSWVNSKTQKLRLSLSDYSFSWFDHYPFVREGIPGIRVTSGPNDDYNRPTDTADKIDLEGLSKRTQLMFYMTWAIANDIKQETEDIKLLRESDGDKILIIAD